MYTEKRALERGRERENDVTLSTVSGTVLASTGQQVPNIGEKSLVETQAVRQDLKLRLSH